MAEHDPTLSARGDATGLTLPATPQALAAAGAPFLTAALIAYGALPAGARVAQVVRCEEVSGGNSGRKALLDVVYEGAPATVPARLFAKFSRDFDDAFRDRRRHELDGEIRLAALSRLPQFPVAVARPVFADFEAASGSGLLITERVAFGEGAIEPLWPKCIDHLLPEPLAHYRALVSAEAQLAAAYQSGRLLPEVERLFPYDPVAAQADLPIGYDAGALRAKVAAWSAFIARHPQLFPAPLRSAEWPARFEAEALAILADEPRVRAFLHADPRFVALSHWNTNIDNAWFWREPDGTLRCGLLDWGMVRVMNVATGIWGGLSACTTAFLEHELDGLLAFHAQELAARGGARVTAEELGVHFDLSLAIAGLSLMMDFPALALARLPAIATASGPLDPLIAQDPVVQGFLLVATNFLTLWERRSFGERALGSSFDESILAPPGRG